MANEPPPKPDDRNLLDEVFGTANPNPSRVGCPTDETLKALARRERPLGDPAYAHLAECSDCYRQIRAYQVRRRRTRAVSALAAVLGLFLVGLWYASQVMQRPTQTATRDPVEPPSVRAELDLRQYRVPRAEEASVPKRPLELTRQRLQVRIILPVGAEYGAYDLQLLDSELRPAASANGIARIEQHSTVLEADLDLRSLTPGVYQLALRRQGESWHLYPARVA